MRFAAEEPFQEGQILRLLVVRGCAFWGFSFTGRVAWVRKNPDTPGVSVGVEFIDVPAATAVAWKELIERAWEYRAGNAPAPTASG